jgi:uncharacterized membrane protein YbhN (UPF0104 family)
MLARLLALIFSLAFATWLFVAFPWASFWESLERVAPWPFFFIVTGMFASYLLRALRIFDELRHWLPISFLQCLRISLIHNAFVNILPLRTGEAAFPLLLKRQFGAELTRSSASLFWLRLQDAFVVAGLACLLWPGLPIGLRLAGLATLVGLAWFLPRWARQSYPWMERPGKGRRLLSRIRTAFAESTIHAKRGWVWTFSNWGIKLGAQAGFLAMLTASSLSVGFAGSLGAELAAILPVQGVAGFGTYEAAAAAAMIPFGLRLPEALAAALTLHLLVIFMACFAGLLAWALGRFKV